MNNSWNYFAGIDGIPFRTKKDAVPFLKSNDVRPITVEEVKVDRFDLSNDEHVKDFQNKLNLCVNGQGRILVHEERYDETIKSWRVLFIWVQFFLEDPMERNNDEIQKRIF